MQKISIHVYSKYINKLELIMSSGLFVYLNAGVSQSMYQQCSTVYYTIFHKTIHILKFLDETDEKFSK